MNIQDYQAFQQEDIAYFPKLEQNRNHHHFVLPKKILFPSLGHYNLDAQNMNRPEAILQKHYPLIGQLFLHHLMKNMHKKQTIRPSKLNFSFSPPLFINMLLIYFKKAESDKEK